MVYGMSEWGWGWMELDVVIWTDKKTGGFYPKIFHSTAFKMRCEVRRCAY